MAGKQKAHGRRRVIIEEKPIEETQIEEEQQEQDEQIEENLVDEEQNDDDEVENAEEIEEKEEEIEQKEVMEEEIDRKQKKKKTKVENIYQGVTFESLGLDDRITHGLARAKFSKPTIVQETAIPIALEGKDILCRARTGSGKTAAYTIPILQKILTFKEANPGANQGVRALILVPTRELSEQVKDHLKEISYYCSRDLTFLNLLSDTPLESQRPHFLSPPDILVTTPSRIVAHLEANHLQLKDTLQTLVIDEADFILSFGYDEDIRKLLKYLPSICQTFLMSATLTPDVEHLKQLVLRNAAILKLEEDLFDESKLTQYSIKCSNEDKFLLLFFILKMRLIQGKCIIFVNDIERCYRLKLFLEQFSIKACVLNAELPYNSRYHIVQQFNQGIYDYIIATDEGEKGLDNENEEDMEVDEELEEIEKIKGNLKKRKGDQEYGVARGVDFRDVEAVINFDFPTTTKSYTHRVGRTARGGKSGISVSLVSPDELDFFKKLEASQESEMKTFAFDMKQVNGFRYRVNDASRAVTKAAVKEARLKELRLEILNSEKLKAHFEDNPRDFEALRHDKAILAARVQPHMKHIPGYLAPNHKKGVHALGLVETKKRKPHKPKNIAHNNNKKGFSKKKDPLRSFHYKKTTKQKTGKK